MQEKYNAFAVAKDISKNTNKAIDQSKPWCFRKFPKLAIILSMVLIDGIMTYISLYIKLSTSPVYTILMTLFFAFILNIPQEFAAYSYKRYENTKKPKYLIALICIELIFIITELYLSMVKIAVTPDLVGITSNLLGISSSAENDKLLIHGIAGTLIVVSIASSAVCFFIDVLEDAEKKKAEILQKTLNANYPLIIQMAGAKSEYETIDAQKLNNTDDYNRKAAQKTLKANTVKNQCLFRDELMKTLTPDGVNDVADEAQRIVEEYEKNNEKEVNA